MAAPPHSGLMAGCSSCCRIVRLKRFLPAQTFRRGFLIHDQASSRAARHDCTDGDAVHRIGIARANFAVRRRSSAKGRAGRSPRTAEDPTTRSEATACTPGATGRRASSADTAAGCTARRASGSSSAPGPSTSDAARRSSDTSHAAAGRGASPSGSAPDAPSGCTRAAGPAPARSRSGASGTASTGGRARAPGHDAASACSAAVGPHTACRNDAGADTCSTCHASCASARFAEERGNSARREAASGNPARRSSARATGSARTLGDYASGDDLTCRGWRAAAGATQCTAACRRREPHARHASSGRWGPHVAGATRSIANASGRWRPAGTAGGGADPGRAAGRACGADCRPWHGGRSPTARQSAIRSADGCTGLPDRTCGRSTAAASAAA